MKPRDPWDALLEEDPWWQAIDNDNRAIARFASLLDDDTSAEPDDRRVAG